MEDISLTVWAWQRRKAEGGKAAVTESLTKLFVDQPLASPGSANNTVQYMKPIRKTVASLK